MRDPDLLRTYAETPDGGLHVIAAPATPELGRLVEGKHVDQILRTAPAAYQVLIVDAGSTLDDRSLAVLDRADAVIVPITPEIGALKALYGLLEFLTEQGAVPAKSLLVLNHIFARDMLSMKQIENAIAARVDAELPYDAGLYLKAVNEGVPLVRAARTSAPGRALARLAAQVAGVEDDSGSSREEKRGGLGAFLRRG
jgi:pilus assembly protein CpaE